MAVTRFLAALNAHDPDAIAACVTAEFHNEHTSQLGESTTGRAAYRERLSTFLAEFGNLHYAVEDVVVEADRAAVAYTMTCTWQSHPVTIRGMFRFQVTDGLVAHRADYWDSADFVRQTVSGEALGGAGAIQPTPGPTAR